MNINIIPHIYITLNNVCVFVYVCSTSICKRRIFEEFCAVLADIPVHTLPLTLRLECLYIMFLPYYYIAYCAALEMGAVTMKLSVGQLSTGKPGRSF